MEEKKEIVEKLAATVQQDKAFEEIQNEVKELKNQFVDLVQKDHKKLKEEHEKSETSEEFKPPHDDLDGRFTELMTQFNQMKKTFDDKRAHELNENLEIKKKIISDLGKLVEEENHIGHAFEKFNELKEKWKNTGHVPNSEYKEVQREYSHQIERFFYNINIYKTLKEYDLQKNLQLKLDLTEKVKALMKNDSIKEVRDLINTYTHEWDEIGPTHQSDWEKVRDAFWESVREVHKKIGDYYKDQKGRLKENLAEKEALCQKVEELAKGDISDVKSYNKSLKEINKIREEWKKIGFAGKKANDEVWQRFRKAMDSFYDHRKEEGEGIKEIFKENEEKKLKLIERAEQMKDSMDWKNTANSYKKLQADWKRVGSTHPSREQKLWKKFRAPSDHFFNRRKDYFDNREVREAENLGKKQEIIGKLENLDVSKDKKANDSIQQLVKDWNTIGFVPKDEKSKIEGAFQKTLNAKMKELGLNAKEIEAQTFEFKVEGLKESDNANELLKNEYRHLDDKLRKIESDIKQYENNLGFFGDNTNNPLVKEVEKKIEESRKEADKIREKINLLNS